INLTLNSVNYRTETIDARYAKAGTFMDLSRFFSNQQVGGQDPQTPIFTAPASANVRFRMLRPGQDDDVVMAVHGHVWQEQPFANRSREIGYNPLSNWFGTAQIGANDKLELLTGRAGGTFGVPGDYMYSGILQAANPQNLGGMWGLMRVTADGVTTTAVHFDAAAPGSTNGTLSVSGVVTKAAT